VGLPFTGRTDERVEKVRKIVAKCHCGDRWQGMPLVWHVLGSSEGEFEDTMGLAQAFFISVSYQPTEASTLSDPQEHGCTSTG
jgi:hypothetical protein